MRRLMTALGMALVLGVAVPASSSAQTRPESHQTDRSPSVTIDLATLGGGALGLVAASGLVSLYNAGSMMFQGAPFAEALEVGAGLPLLAAAGAVLLGGYYGRDIVKQAIAPLTAGAEADEPAPSQPAKPSAKPAH